MSAPPPALAARFAADCRALIAAEPAPNAPLALAVSGGPDSVAMLALGAAAFPGAVIAATIDHRLRPESAGEGAMVAGVCARMGVPHCALVVEDAPGRGDNLHVWARARRYALLGGWAREAGAAALLTAHQADDQAETFLMRAARGSGLAGLAGIRASHPGEAGVPIIRPLLGWRRAELEEVARQAGLPFVSDPSNADARFDRARLRGWLAGTDLDIAAIARSAAYLAEVEQDLRALATWLIETRAVAGEAELSIDVAGLPRGVRRLIARAGIAELRRRAARTEPAFGEASNVEPLLDALEAGKAATQAGVLVRVKGSVWRFVEAPARRSH